MEHNTEEDIKQVCGEIQALLIQKNRSYGDSALNPARIFSRCDTLEQINVRMDDKLSRLMRGDKAAAESLGEDLEQGLEDDLLGYLFLKKIKRLRMKREKEEQALMPQTPVSAVPPRAHLFNAHKSFKHCVAVGVVYDYLRPDKTAIEKVRAHYLLNFVEGSVSSKIWGGSDDAMRANMEEVVRACHATFVSEEDEVIGIVSIFYAYDSMDVQKFSSSHEDCYQSHLGAMFVEGVLAEGVNKPKEM